MNDLLQLEDEKKLQEKVGKLKAKLRRLQSAYSQPRIYLVEYFADLINRVDIAAEKFLADQKDGLNDASKQARSDQAKIVKTIKERENEVLNAGGFREDPELDNRIRNVGVRLETPISWSDVGEICWQMEEMQLLLQRRCFMDKGLWFWDDIGLDNCRREGNELGLKPFGILIVLEDEFVIDEWDTDTDILDYSYDSHVLTEEELKFKYFNEHVQSQWTTFNFPVHTIRIENVMADLKDIRPWKRYGKIITTLQPGVFRSLLNLKILRLDSRGLKSLASNIFKDLQSLEILMLSFNNLSIIHTDTFTGLENLKELNMSDNSLNCLGSHVFRQLKKLEILILTNNHLTCIDPHAFASLLNLKSLELNVGYNHDFKLSNLDASVFKDLKNLESLDLSCQKLTSFVTNFFSGLRNLKTLDLSQNQITNLDSNVFTDLAKLEELFLIRNKFASIQPEVFRPLVNLKKLSLDSDLLDASHDLWITVGKSYANWAGFEYSESGRTRNIVYFCGIAMEMVPK